jgi:hypothetical protein
MAGGVPTWLVAAIRTIGCALALFVAASVLVAPPSIARGGAAVEILETDPALPAILARGKPFSLRVSYSSNEPVVIRAEPRLGGRAVPMINGGVARRGAGRGEVLLWFASDDAAQIDRVAVSAATPSGKVLARTSLDVALAWTAQAAAENPAPAPWVVRLRAEETERERAEAKSDASRSEGWLMDLIGLVVMAGVPVYFVLQAWLLWRLRSGWRYAAIAPLLPMSAVIVWTALAFAAGSNLFPLVLIFTAPVACAYLLIVTALHWLSRLRPGGAQTP